MSRVFPVFVFLVLIVGCDPELTYEYTGSIEKVEYDELVRTDAKGYQKISIFFDRGPKLEAFISEDLRMAIIKSSNDFRKNQWYKIICEKADYRQFGDESFGRKIIIAIDTVGGVWYDK